MLNRPLLAAAILLAAAPARPLGKTGEFDKLPSLDTAWVLNSLRQVGNHGKPHERGAGTGGSLKLNRGRKALWAQGGLVLPIPFR